MRLKSTCGAQRFVVRSKSELKLIKRMIRIEVNRVAKKEPDNLLKQMTLIELYHKANAAWKRTTMS